MSRKPAAPDPSRGLRTVQEIYRSLAVLISVLTVIAAVVVFFGYSQYVEYTRGEFAARTSYGNAFITAVLVLFGGLVGSLGLYAVSALIGLALRVEADVHYTAHILYEVGVSSRETADLLRMRMGKPAQSAEPAPTSKPAIRQLPT